MSFKPLLRARRLVTSTHSPEPSNAIFLSCNARGLRINTEVHFLTIVFCFAYHRQHLSHHAERDRALERHDLVAVVFSAPGTGLLFYAKLVQYNRHLFAFPLEYFVTAFYFIFQWPRGSQRIKFRIIRKVNIFTVLFMRITFITANIPRMDVKPLDF